MSSDDSRPTEWLAHFLKHRPALVRDIKAQEAWLTVDRKEPIQQSNYLKPFLMKIVDDGLQKAYDEYGSDVPGPTRPTAGKISPHVSTDVDVIIVGAGMAGLAAAYELKKAGRSVKVLEATNRIGGRVWTYKGKVSKTVQFAAGLYGEAGAMRIPCENEPDVSDENRYKNSTHFLTDAYIRNFKLPTQPFLNDDKNGITKIYGLQAKTKDWGEKHFNEVWPEWKNNIKGIYLKDIKSVDQYYNCTTRVVTDQLRKWLQSIKATGDDKVDAEIQTWARWIDIWSMFSLEGFLESNMEAILAKIPKPEDQEFLDDLKDLLPWPEDAIRGYSTTSYTEQLDQSLVQYLRDQLGEWWSENMHSIQGGMCRLPEAFVAAEEGKDNMEEEDKGKLKMNEDIKLQHNVKEITYSYNKDSPMDDKVTVVCYPTEPGTPDRKFTAKAVIVTTPVNILRQITFKCQSLSKLDTEAQTEPPKEFYQAIENIFTGPSTKIFIQTKTRFWEEKKYGIKGGFSKTNLPIGQLHYVSPEKPEGDDTKEGLLLIYTWKNEALLFGSMEEKDALREAVEQIATIHPEITKGYDDNGIVHAWYNKPYAQGAYGLLKPKQFNNIRYLWYPMGNVHFAGETFSFAAGWIQGALESGLKAAYQVYERFQCVQPEK